MVKEKDLEDPVKAKEMEVIKAKGTRTTIVIIINQRKRLLLSVSTWLGWQVRLASMR